MILCKLMKHFEQMYHFSLTSIMSVTLIKLHLKHLYIMYIGLSFNTNSAININIYYQKICHKKNYFHLTYNILALCNHINVISSYPPVSYGLQHLCPPSSSFLSLSLVWLLYKTLPINGTLCKCESNTCGKILTTIYKTHEC